MNQKKLSIGSKLGARLFSVSPKTNWLTKQLSLKQYLNLELKIIMFNISYAI